MARWREGESRGVLKQIQILLNLAHTMLMLDHYHGLLYRFAFPPGRHRPASSPRPSSAAHKEHPLPAQDPQRGKKDDLPPSTPATVMSLSHHPLFNLTASTLKPLLFRTLYSFLLLTVFLAHTGLFVYDAPLDHAFCSDDIGKPLGAPRFLHLPVLLG